jgi:hypothetical protein
MFAQILSLKFTEMGIIMEVTPKGSGRATMGNVRKEADESNARSRMLGVEG